MRCLTMGVVSCSCSKSIRTNLLGAMIQADFGVIRGDGVKECGRKMAFALAHATPANDEV